MTDHEEVEKAEELIEQLRELNSMSSDLKRELREGHKVGKVSIKVERNHTEVLFDEEFRLEEGVKTYRNVDGELSMEVKTEELEWEPEDDV